MAYNILLIEDEKIIAHNIKEYLQKEGYTFDVVHSGEDGLILFQKNKYQLVLLDLMLPRMGGSEFLKEIRKYDNVPVIVISALNDELTQDDLYALKIDDYITKPFSLKILMHKIQAVFRRIYGEEPKEISYKNIVLIPNNYQVYDHGELLELTKKEFELLQLLMMNQGKVFTREQLLMQLWDYDKDYRTINVHIGNLRSKLTEDIIMTIRGIGYKVGK